MSRNLPTGGGEGIGRVGSSVRVAGLALIIVSTLLVLPPRADAQVTVSAVDTVGAAALGYRHGRADGQRQSLTGVRWGTVATTFLLTPLLGGVGSLVAAYAKRGFPDEVPQVVPEATTPAYQEHYREGYRERYLPRYRRTVRRSVLVTTVAFVAGAFVMAG